MSRDRHSANATLRRTSWRNRRPRLWRAGSQCAGAALALIAPSAWAQFRPVPPDTSAISETPGITVTGHPLPDGPATPAYDVETIGRAAITTSASDRIEDVLGGVAGFQSFRRSDSRSTNPSAEGITLRALGGNAASRTLVLLDGVPVADPLFGSVPLAAIAPERLEAIRVTRGGGSGAFGAGAVAGTIELDSAGPATLGAVSGGAFVDDRGESEMSATLAPQLGAGFVVASARWDRGQGFWTTPPDQRVAASVRARYDDWSLALRGVAPIAPAVELQGGALLFDSHNLLRFAGATSADSGEDASLRLIARGPWQVDALAYVQARDFSNVVVSATSYRPVLDQRRTPATGIGGKVELRPPLGVDWVVRLGSDARIASGTMFETSLSPTTGAPTAQRRAGGRNDDFGLFAQADRTAGAVVLTAGLRADRWRIADGEVLLTTPAGAVTSDTLYPTRAGWQASVRGGAVWRAADALALRASAYTGLRLPTLNELYRTYVISPVTTLANPALSNERLVGAEAGADWTVAPGMKLSATAFTNRLAHAIANVTIGTNLRQRENVDAIRARGVELTLAARRGAWSLDGSLALTDAVVEASGAAVSLNGLRPAQTPRLAASATLGWVPRPGWQMSATVRRVGAQYEDDLATYVLPGVTVVDATASMRVWRGMSIMLRGENLGDVAVETRNQAGSIDLGTPRTVWLGVRFGR